MMLNLRVELQQLVYVCLYVGGVGAGLSRQQGVGSCQPVVQLLDAGREFPAVSESIASTNIAAKHIIKKI